MNQNDKYIIGLGNPGKEYQNNRHNIGFLFLQTLSEKHNSKFLLKNKIRSWYSEFHNENVTYRLFMPDTFMNESGIAVKAILDWFKIDLSQLYIVLDDIDLPIGKIRFRKQGSSGGHNGLKSIIQQLNTQKFNRIRLGIGSPPIIQQSRDFNTISHVLGNFSAGEKLILNKVYKHLTNSIESLPIKKEEYIMSELNSFYAGKKSVNETKT